MPNFGDTLDTVIAVVIVLLVLSLVVQAIQTFVKKLFKLKSRSIVASLEDLFENVLTRPATPAAAAAGTTGQPAAGAAAAATPSFATPQKLVKKVQSEFKRLGRVTLLGRPMLDSVAKNDLLKVLTKIAADEIAPGSVARFQALWTEGTALQAALAGVKTDLLEGSANAKFAALREAFAPLLNDLNELVSGTQVRADVFFGDLVRLRQVKIVDVLNLLGEIQQSVAANLAAAQTANNAAQVTALTALAAQLRALSDRVIALGAAFDTAFVGLQARLTAVENWYDTVMQGFEERYTRHMRTVAFVISLCVVVLLNADFFKIYGSFANNPAQRTAALDLKSQLDALQRAQPQPTPAPATQTATAGTPATTPAGGAAATPAATPTATPANDAAQVQQLQAELAQLRQATSDNVANYQSLGFQLLTWADVQTWWASKDRGTAGLRHDLQVLLGWLIMAALLSIGAPFWQDTLESLFGVKNLLRKKSDTKNVETESGAGQPRS